MNSSFVAQIVDLPAPLFSVNNEVWRDEEPIRQTSDLQLLTGYFDPSQEIEHHVQAWSAATGSDYSDWVRFENGLDEGKAAVAFEEAAS